MPRVFIINNTSHDYSSATKYGTVVSITEGKMPIFKTDLMKEILTKALENFTSNDYLLISGPAWLCVMTSAILYKRLDEVKFLIFDAKEQSYVVRHFRI